MTEEESEESTLFRTKGIPGGLERFEWIGKLENIHNADKLNTSPTLQQLYPQSKYCYIHECYLASTVVASIAVEAHLRINQYGISPPEKISFFQLIKNATDNNHITDELAERLQRLRDTMRNYIVHPDSMFGIRFLGLKKVGPSTWGELDGPTMKTDKEAAEEAIECLLTLNKEYPFKIRTEKQTEKEYSPSPMP